MGQDLTHTLNMEIGSKERSKKLGEDLVPILPEKRKVFEVMNDLNSLSDGESIAYPEELKTIDKIPITMDNIEQQVAENIVHFSNNKQLCVGLLHGLKNKEHKFTINLAHETRSLKSIGHQIHMYARCPWKIKDKYEDGSVENVTLQTLISRTAFQESKVGPMRPTLDTVNVFAKKEHDILKINTFDPAEMPLDTSFTMAPSLLKESIGWSREDRELFPYIWEFFVGLHNNEMEASEYMMNFDSRLIGNPFVKHGQSPFYIDNGGTGKSSRTAVLVKILGITYASDVVINPTDRFDVDGGQKCFTVINEVGLRSLYQLNTFKAMVTEEHVIEEQKFNTPMQVDNHNTFYFNLNAQFDSTEQHKPQKINENDMRRFLAFSPIKNDLLIKKMTELELFDPDAGKGFTMKGIKLWKKSLMRHYLLEGQHFVILNNNVADNERISNAPAWKQLTKIQTQSYTEEGGTEFIMMLHASTRSSKVTELSFLNKENAFYDNEIAKILFKSNPNVTINSNVLKHVNAFLETYAHALGILKGKSNRNGQRYELINRENFIHGWNKFKDGSLVTIPMAPGSITFNMADQGV